jgi:hypothetical protein
MKKPCHSSYPMPPEEAQGVLTGDPAVVFELFSH